MHADHHLGAIRIILKRQQLLHQLQSSPSSSTTQLNPNEPFLIIGPDNFSYWLSEYSLIEPLSYQFVSCEDVAAQERFVFLFSSSFTPLPF
jgi:hypothetical protein